MLLQHAMNVFSQHALVVVSEMGQMHEQFVVHADSDPVEAFTLTHFNHGLALPLSPRVFLVAKKSRAEEHARQGRDNQIGARRMSLAPEDGWGSTSAGVVMRLCLV